MTININYMKKVFLFLIIIIFYGCEKDFNNVVQTSLVEFQVRTLSSIDKFNLTPEDSIVYLTITFDNSKQLTGVSATIYNPEGKRLGGIVTFNDAGVNGDITANDNTFTGALLMKDSYLNGNYRVEYFASTKSNPSIKLGVQQFEFNNGTSNLAPEILNVEMVNEVTVVDTSLIHIAAEVSDPNGLSDIESVYFIVTRPDGTSNGLKNFLYDNGNSNNGDAVAGDGIYSLIISVYSTNQKGTYRFDFQAKDRGKKLSPIYSKNITIN